MAQDTAPRSPSSGPLEIYLIGSVHGMHFEERYGYSLIDLQAQVRSVQPEVICGEITPDAYNGPMEGNFPPEAAMLAELAPGWGARFIPADWRIRFSRQDRAARRLARNKAKEAIDAEESREKAYFENYAGNSLYDYTAGSPHFQQMVDHKFEDLVGENTVADISYGDWHQRNRMIVENCLAHAGLAGRIAFVFGASHLPELSRQLAKRGLRAKIPARAFTPAGLGTMPLAVIARWQRNLKNLEGIANRTVKVSNDNRAKMRDTNRAPALRNEIDLYLARAPQSSSPAR